MRSHHSAAYHGTTGYGVGSPGASIVPQITSADTAGHYSVFDYHAPPHFAGPPLHQHAYTTEWCYVVAGTLAFTLDDATITIERGETLVIEPGVAHTFWNPTADPASLLMITTPGGGDQWYAALSAPNDDRRQALPDTFDVRLLAEPTLTPTGDRDHDQTA